ncbi:MAG TPA: FAD-binding oxidoreductase [Candidatus Limnocylindrales bacterium]|nr:FAD-binding oxidoreductase [Candidatus Limnocylindrales bacterium]
MSQRRRKFWGWGYEGEGPTVDHQDAIGAMLTARLGGEPLQRQPEPRIEEIELPRPRVKPPSSLEALCTTAPLERAGHTYGKAFRDVVRAYRRDFSPAPDVVAFPATEADLVAVLDWCSGSNVAAIPYGGGSSVMGGTEARGLSDGYAGAVTIDLSRLGRVLEIDRSSRAARIQAGAYGPALEEALRPHGLTLRHFPQSFEFSTLGGWIATRSGGHYATLYTHIDDFVESLRVVTPAGTLESRRLPGSGAGPSPDRLFIGSEGTLGIITEAWMRLQDRPKYRSSVTVLFDDYYAAARAVRAVGQAGLYPTNLRLLDANEAMTSGAGDGVSHVLILGFESADHPLDAWMARALELVGDHGGRYPEGAGKTRTDEAATREGAAGAWRDAFLRAPYLRDALVGLGAISDTFETSITWDRFEQFHAGVTEAVLDVVRRRCGGGSVTCRFTHVYPDGPAPYFTILAPSKPQRQLEDWDAIKEVACDAVLRLGGTITHHHAVGRDHRPWYDRQRPELFARALTAAKRELDPAGVMNPGVLIDPVR